MSKQNKYYLRRIIMLIAGSISLLLYSQQHIPECHIKEPGNAIYVVAHRGAHKGIPENSIAAYQKAIDIGCDFVEIDVRTTKDGKFVSIHNSKVDEYTAGSKGKVSEMNLDKLRSLDIGIKTGPEWKGTKIPTFEEILEVCKGKTGIYLDLKAASVTQLVDIIKSYGMEKEIIWYISSSDIKNINELKTSCPTCILMADPGPGKNIESVVNNYNPCMIATDMDQLGAEFVNIAHHYNKKVIADEHEGIEAEWRQMLEWNTDGIQTDDPEALISFLKSRKH